MRPTDRERGTSPTQRGIWDRGTASVPSVNRQVGPAPTSGGGGSSTSRAAGFGTNPNTFSIKLEIVGHASPRSRGARSRRQADRQNERLSKRRANAVRKVIIEAVRDISDTAIIEDVTRPEGEAPPGIDLGTTSVGNQESLREAGGDGSNNDPYYRRVDIAMTVTTTWFEEVGRSLELKQLSIPNASTLWSAQVTRIAVDAFGVAHGYIEIVLTNERSGAKMVAYAELWGGGISVDPRKLAKRVAVRPENVIAKVGTKRLGQALKDALGREKITFTTDSAINFERFTDPDVTLRFGLARVGAGVVYTSQYITFVGLGKGASWLKFDSGLSLGLPTLDAHVVAGRLQLAGPDQPDFRKIDNPFTDDRFRVPVQGESVADQMFVLFETDSHTLTKAQSVELKEFVAATISRRR